MNVKKNLLDLNMNELKEEIKKLNEPAFRADQIFISIHKKNVLKPDDIKGLSAGLKRKLDNNFIINPLTVVNKVESKKFNTKKFLFETDSGIRNHRIETVLISEKDRNTICISTQSGCNVGCEFCATGKMGFQKNLTCGEIVSQIYEVKKHTGITPTNIVYMGMGEPFLNYENMFKSLQILTNKNGLGISSRRITVSTVGFKGKIKMFADDIAKEENKSVRNVKLALSLHTTDNGIREMLIPTSKKNRMPELYKELEYFYRVTKNKITYEYIFFEGINDKDEDVKRLAGLSKMLPSNINIIAFHPIGYSLQKPLDVFNGKMDTNNLLSNKKLIDFIARLKNEKVTVHLRNSSGIDINAACGQLAGNSN